MRGLVQVGDRARGRIEQIDQRGEGIAEEARNAQRHVHPRPVEQVQGQDLEPRHAQARRIPGRLDAHQGQSLGDVIPAGTHVGCAPGRKRHRARPIAVFLGVPFEEKSRRFPAERPSRRRGHRAGIDRIEVAPGRQHVRPAARGRAGRAGCHAPPVERGEQGGDFGGTAGIEARGEFRADPFGDGGARGAGRRTACGQCHGGVLQRVRTVGIAAQIARERAMQRFVAGARAGPGGPRDRGQRIGARAALGRSAEDVQPVADLMVLEFAQRRVELRQGGV